MGIFTYEIEFTSVLPPSTLFKAIVFDADEFIPKIAPRAVKSVEVLKGDGGVGTIKKVYLGEGSEYSYVTHRIDGIDTDNYVYKYSLIEGDALTEKIEKISYEIKLEASADGGTIIKNISHYHTVGDVVIKGEDVKAGKIRAHGLFKIIENHLLASPFLSFLSLRQSIKTGHERVVLSEQQTKSTKHILHDGIGSNLVFLCFLCLFSALAYRFFFV